MTYRKIESHRIQGGHNGIEIYAVGERGPGGANHNYTVDYKLNNGVDRCLNIWFQNGPIPQEGNNGITNEALLAIVIDRLEGFQAGEFASSLNERALTGCKMALNALHDRTEERLKRGVEGKLEP